MRSDRKNVGASSSKGHSCWFGYQALSMEQHDKPSCPIFIKAQTKDKAEFVRCTQVADHAGCNKRCMASKIALTGSKSLRESLSKGRITNSRGLGFQGNFESNYKKCLTMILNL